jgi:hypothetical protein
LSVEFGVDGLQLFVVEDVTVAGNCVNQILALAVSNSELTVPRGEYLCGKGVRFDCPADETEGREEVGPPLWRAFG